MMKIGSARLPASSLSGPDAEALRHQDRREADREQVDGERPDDVEEPREHAVDAPPEEAGREADGRSEQARQQRGGDADEQRVAAAVEQARGHVAALVVGAEEVVLGIPGRPDRRHAEPKPLGLLLHHRNRLAVDDGRAVEVRAERIRVCDVLGVQGRGERQQDDHEQQAEHRHRDPVAPEPAASQRPWAGARRGCGGGLRRRACREGVAHPRRAGGGRAYARPPHASLLHP